jgi:hypothetical protein
LVETISVTGIFWVGPEVFKVKVAPGHRLGIVEAVHEAGGATVTLTIRL